jgi:hydrogenase maturation protein HypF
MKGEEAMLTGHQKPILLLRRRSSGQLSELAAPGNPKIGIMLPYAPVQMLLFDYPDSVTMPDALIMTSGNPAGAPICRDDAGAIDALSGFTDLMLSHNRKIRIRADDTVMDWLDGRPLYDPPQPWLRTAAGHAEERLARPGPRHRR